MRIQVKVSAKILVPKLHFTFEFAKVCRSTRRNVIGMTYTSDIFVSTFFRYSAMLEVRHLAVPITFIEQRLFTYVYREFAY